MRIIFASFIDKNETQVMHTKSDSIEIMNGINTSDATYEKISRRIRNKNEGKQLYI